MVKTTITIDRCLFGDCPFKAVHDGFCLTHHLWWKAAYRESQEMKK